MSLDLVSMRLYLCFISLCPNGLQIAYVTDVIISVLIELLDVCRSVSTYIGTYALSLSGLTMFCTVICQWGVGDDLFPS